MAFILCIETATPVCSVALFENTTLLHSEEIADGNVHASALTGLIQNCTGQTQVTLNQLDAIAISKGPGSYTGLRVGVATAKGLCFTLQKPLIAVSTLKSLANQFKQQHPEYRGLLCPMIDARRMEVYTALYDADLKEILGTEARIINDSSYAYELKANSIAFFGSGSDKCSGIITDKNAHFNNLACSASSMGSLAYNKLCAKQFEDLAYFEPDYLKEFAGK